MSLIGNLALVLALVFSVYALFANALSGYRKRPYWGSRGSLVFNCALITFSILVLLGAVIFHDFSLRYAAEYSNRATSLPYLISALWAGNSGSLLFWAWLLSIFAVVVAFRKRSTGKDLLPYSLAVIMLAQVFFILIILVVASPFQRLSPPPADGQGLNPLLENPGMILHPSVLLAGYAGFIVPFAFAIAALLKNRLDNEWLISVRRWTLFSWLLLGIGNIIGAWWAYVELGWGGYWAWDPVENAGLMPWLTATALLHSIILQKRKGLFKTWNLLLVIITFNLAIFGTFLTRSGFLSSVHTFGQTGLEPFFLTFLCITFVVPLGLLFHRRESLRSQDGTEAVVSRESAFLLNNILLIGATIVVFLGTLFPGITQAINGVKVEVGQAFFNRVNGPIFMAIVLLAGVCTLIGWRRGTSREMGFRFLWPLLAAVLLDVLLLVLGVRRGLVLGAVFILAFPFTAIIQQWLRETAAAHRAGKSRYLSAWWHLLQANRPRYGGYIVHLSIIIFALGVIGSSSYGDQKDAVLRPGESMTIQGYKVTYDKINLDENSGRMVMSASLSVYRGDALRYHLRPAKIFTAGDQSVAEVAIHSNPVEDLYVILASWKDGAATFRILVNPMIMWLWIGGGIFLLGGLVAFWPGRRDMPAVKSQDEMLEGYAGEAAEETTAAPAAQASQPGAQYCPQCGAKRRENDRFCTGCGKRWK